MTTLGEGRSVCGTIQTRCISGPGVPIRCENRHRWLHHGSKSARTLPRVVRLVYEPSWNRRVKRKPGEAARPAK